MPGVRACVCGCVCGSVGAGTAARRVSCRHGHAGGADCSNAPLNRTSAPAGASGQRWTVAQLQAQLGAAPVWCCEWKRHHRPHSPRRAAVRTAVTPHTPGTPALPNVPHTHTHLELREHAQAGGQLVNRGSIKPDELGRQRRTRTTSLASSTAVGGCRRQPGFRQRAPRLARRHVARGLWVCRVRAFGSTRAQHTTPCNSGLRQSSAT
jgi:hypothetical protein